MRRLRIEGVVGGLPQEIIAGVVIISVAAAATGIFSPSAPPHTAASAVVAGGGGASAATTSPTSTTVPPTTTTTTAPPTTTPAPPAAAPAGARATPTTTRPPPPPPTPVHSAAAVGVYTGAGDSAGAAGFAAATGAPVTVVEDYLPGGPWAQVDGSEGLDWLFGPWRGSGYQLVLGVPILDNSGTDTLAAGAAGAYNAYFVTLAHTLVASGQGNAILRLGQEFTGNWNLWRVTDLADAVDYAAYYRQIVTAMRSVDPDLRFIWEGADPQDGSYPGAYTAIQAYPGDGYVNYIGADTYDQSWQGSCGLAFDNTTTAAESQCSWATGPLPGLTRVAAFAAAHGKPVAFPEWGLAIRGDGHGMGDDPTYIEEMGAWTSSHSVAFAIYFNFDVAGQVDAITDGRFPASLAAFRSTFG